MFTAVADSGGFINAWYFGLGESSRYHEQTPALRVAKDQRIVIELCESAVIAVVLTDEGRERILAFNADHPE